MPNPAARWAAKGKPLTVTGGGARAVNTNAAITIQARHTSKGRTGTSARTATQWHATARVASFGRAVDKQQSIDAARYWKAMLTTSS